MRELLVYHCRFGERNEFLQGMGSNLLAARPSELEQGGLIQKPDADNKRTPYQLTLVGYRFAEPNADYAHRHHWDLLAIDSNGCNHGMGQRMDVDLTFTGMIQSLRSLIVEDELNKPTGLMAFADSFELPQ